MTSDGTITVTVEAATTSGDVKDLTKNIDTSAIASAITAKDRNMSPSSLQTSESVSGFVFVKPRNSLASTIVGATEATSTLLIASLKAVYESEFGSSFKVDDIVYLDERAQLQCRVSASSTTLRSSSEFVTKLSNKLSNLTTELGTRDEEWKGNTDAKAGASATDFVVDEPAPEYSGAESILGRSCASIALIVTTYLLL